MRLEPDLDKIKETNMLAVFSSDWDFDEREWGELGEKVVMKEWNQLFSRRRLKFPISNMILEFSKFTEMWVILEGSIWEIKYFMGKGQVNFGRGVQEIMREKS